MSDQGKIERGLASLSAKNLLILGILFFCIFSLRNAHTHTEYGIDLCPASING